MNNSPEFVDYDLQNFWINILNSFNVSNKSIEIDFCIYLNLLGEFLDNSLERPHIKLCIPPSSGGKDLVTIKYINHISI